MKKQTKLNPYVLKVYDLALALCSGLADNRIYDNWDMHFASVMNPQWSVVQWLDRLGPLGFGTCLVFMLFSFFVTKSTGDPELTPLENLTTRATLAFWCAVLVGLVAFIAGAVALAVVAIVLYISSGVVCLVSSSYPFAFAATVICVVAIQQLLRRRNK